jgi:nitrate/nitrite transporter NarK
VALAVVPAAHGPLDWRAPYVMALVVAALAAILLRLAPAAVRPAAPVTQRAATLSLATDPRLLQLAALFAASFGLSVVIGNWVVKLIEDETLVSTRAAGAIGACTLILGVLSRPLGGWILHERPHLIRPAIVASALGGAIGTLALATGSTPLAVVGTCLIGLASGIPFAAAFTRAARLYPGSPATAIGLVNGVGALTILTGTALTGFAFSRELGIEAFLVMAALWAASAVLATGVPRPRSG